MAIVQISQIQLRRGLQQDLPQLASAEMGWSLDSRRLYIGNGTLLEGAPTEGVTEILTEHSNFLSYFQGYTFENLASGAQVITGVNSLNPVTRTLQNKLDDMVSVKDFGAVGDGITDDTAAIQRALTNTFASAETVNGAVAGYRKTIYFPAGQYRITSTLSIPPYCRLLGEGKRTTTVTGNFAAPIARLVDSNNQSGSAFGYNGAQTAEYHVSDMGFVQSSTSYNQSCFVADGGKTASFNRVLFQGALSSTSGTLGLSTSNPIYDIDRTDGTYGVGGPAGVKLTGASNYSAISNFSFSQCDFVQLCYGIELYQNSSAVSVANCWFDQMYHYAVIGNSGSAPATAPYAISFTNNNFLHCAREGILSYPFATQISSTANNFLAYGISDFQSGNVLGVNPTGIAGYAAISFNADNNSSIGDNFQAGPTGTATATAGNLITVNSTTTMATGTPIRFVGGTAFGGIVTENQYYVNTVVNTTNISVSNTATGSNIAWNTDSGTLKWIAGNPTAGVPYVKDNGYINYQVTPDIGVVDGRKTIGRARTTTLANTNSFVSANLTYMPSSYTNLKMEYTLNHATTQRTGVFNVSRVASTYIYDEEYNESGALGTSAVVFQANATTGDIEYTSIASGPAATLTYSLNHYKA